jgi:hypothetical protein
VADVAAVADPSTGVAVYDTYGGSGWNVFGGTSAAAPLAAAIYAATGHATATAQLSYSTPADFFDVTTGLDGSCGNYLCTAGAGYDGPTGNGTPNGAALNSGSCTASCTGKQCGDDGCGGSCGTCGTGSSCNSSGQCVATSCAHPICSTGTKLTSGCDACVASICAKDSYCCGTSWDSTCVGEVSSVCGQSCSSGSCAHSECTAGAKLKKGCNACTTKVCAHDAYCCSTSWDSQCVSEVATYCGESC